MGCRFDFFLGKVGGLGEWNSEGMGGGGVGVAKRPFAACLVYYLLPNNKA